MPEDKVNENISKDKIKEREKDYNVISKAKHSVTFPYCRNRQGNLPMIRVPLK